MRDDQFWSDEKKAFWKQPVTTKIPNLAEVYQKERFSQWGLGRETLVKYPLVVRALKLFRMTLHTERFECRKYLKFSFRTATDDQRREWKDIVSTGSFPLFRADSLKRAVRFAINNPEVDFIYGPEEGQIPVPQRIWTTLELTMSRTTTVWGDEKTPTIPWQDSVREILWERE